MTTTVPKRPFGRTGHMSSVTLFGAAALKAATQTQADRTLDVLLEYGVNHLDTAPRYGDAELRIGAWMPEHRRRFFLATKTGERTYAGAREEFARSLERLRTDHVDLIQLHALYHPDEWDVAMGEEGALRYLIEAREQGLCRHIGVTGHGWTIAAMHRRSLEHFDFDSVLMPYNYFMSRNERYMQDFEAVMKICSERNVAVQTIKALARGAWGSAKPNRATWYQPLEAPADIDRAMHWAMGRDGIFLNTVGDMDLLPLALDAASRYEHVSTDEEMAALSGSVTMGSLFGLGT